MITVERCPVCRHVVSGAPFEVGGQPLTRCAACHVVHALTHADPASVYVEGYHSGAGGYHLDADREPFASYVRQVDDRRVARVRRAVDSPASLLDVGCGRGRFVAVAAAAGYTAEGLEPVDETAAAARAAGLAIRTGVLEEASGSWDVVTAFHVLEHVPDVPASLASLRSLVAPGGALVVEVPNWRSLCRREAGDRWSLLSPGEHITFFSGSVLRRALEDAGFAQVVVESPTWIGKPQDLGQALTDLGLRRTARALTPLCRKEGPVLKPRRVGWAALQGISRLESRALAGLTLLAVARP